MGEKGGNKCGRRKALRAVKVGIMQYYVHSAVVHGEIHEREKHARNAIGTPGLFLLKRTNARRPHLEERKQTRSREKRKTF